MPGPALTSPPNVFLRDLWYYAMPSAQLKAGAMKTKLLLSEPVVFLRASTGALSAMRDICPHRGIPLSYGAFDGKEVECCYHGWRFDCSGVCTAIPSLAAHENIDPGNIRVRTYEVRESQGGIWIFMDDPKRKGASRPPVPLIPGLPLDEKPAISEVMNFPCYIDHAVIGLMDPAHGPFVHQAWWWRSRGSIHEKAKPFGPSHLGFTMRRHKPSKNSFAYRLLGGVPETEISFQLPGIRIEHIQAGRTVVGNLTCVTPISETETEITNTIYTNSQRLKLIAPVVKIFARRFLEQDRNVVVMQQEGLR
nr:aromatic ring-hydroxylating dioxygenase subunit alpha [Pseudomonadota bacterium]